MIMKDFLIGLGIGALGAYVAVKLSDEKTREKIKEEIGYGVSLGIDAFKKAQDFATQSIGEITGSIDKTVAEVEEKVENISI